MKNKKTFKDLIQLFLEGATQEISASLTLKIVLVNIAKKLMRKNVSCFGNIQKYIG